jgi:hypothetical protein
MTDEGCGARKDALDNGNAGGWIFRSVEHAREMDVE